VWPPSARSGVTELVHGWRIDDGTS